MVRTRVGHQHRAFGSCECCPASRAVAQLYSRETHYRAVPLPWSARLAFLMGASNTAVPRLADGCVESLRNLPPKVISRIFDWCTTTERVIVGQPPQHFALRSALPPPPPSRVSLTASLSSRNPRDPLGGDLAMGELSLCEPCP